MYNDIIQGLTSTHRNIERVLTLMRLQLDALQATDAPTAYSLLNNAVRYMRGYPDLVHHPCEEDIFNRLAGYNPSSAVACSRLIAQHKEFHQQELKLLDHIRLARNRSTTAIYQLQGAGAAYCTAQAEHMHSEETHIFPRAMELFSEADWHDINRRMVPLADALFQQGHFKHYDNLYEHLMGAAPLFNMH